MSNESETPVKDLKDFSKEIFLEIAERKLRRLIRDILKKAREDNPLDLGDMEES